MNARNQVSTRKITRSRLGCLTCRSRKVKCDETSIECQNCQRMGLECQWSDRLHPRLQERQRYKESTTNTYQSLHPQPIAGENEHIAVKRHRHSESSRASACLACRTTKQRCSKGKPKCDRCGRNGTICQYSTRGSGSPSARSQGYHVGKRSSPDRGTSYSSHSPAQYHTVSSSNSGLAIRAELETLIDAFFRHVYPSRANAFIDRKDLLQDIDTSGPLSGSTLKAMCAISFRFLDSADNSHSDGGSQAFTLAKEIVADIMVDIQEFSEARLATILLMAQHEHESGRYGSSWMLIPMAVRMAFTLRLNLELDDSYPWKYRETRRRLMWATFCLDKMTFGGISEFSSIETRRMKIDLPSPNHNFENDIPVPGRTLGEVQSAADTSTNSQIDQDGLVSRYIRLTDIRSDVLSYTKNLSENASLAWEQDSPFQLCFQRLQQWQDSLPPLLIFSLSNLQHGQEDVIALFYLHIFYHQIHCDLYRMTLPGFRESAPPEYLARAPVGWVNRTRDACYLHAVEIIKKISFMAEHFDHFIPNDSVLIIFVYECIRNQIQYIKITYPGGPSREDHQQVSTGFEMIMDVAGRTVKYFGRIWRALRDINHMLKRNDYPISSTWETLLHHTMSGAASPIAGPVLSKFHPVRRLDILPRPAVAQSGLEDDHQSARSALSSSGNKGQLPSGTWGDEAECATPSGTADTHPIGRYGTVDHGLSAPSVSPGMADMTALDGLWLQIDEILGIPYTTPATSFAAEWLADGGQEDLTAANSDFQPVFHFSL